MNDMDEAMDAMDEVMREFVALAIRKSVDRKSGASMIGGQVTVAEYTRMHGGDDG